MRLHIGAKPPSKDRDENTHYVIEHATKTHTQTRTRTLDLNTRRPPFHPLTPAHTRTPRQVLVVGAGVAGLAAIAQAKAMGAVVRAYDVRPVVREQIESLGAEFLQVEYEEDGSGAGGYAKEMSDGWKEVGGGGIQGVPWLRRR